MKYYKIYEGGNYLMNIEAKDKASAIKKVKKLGYTGRIVAKRLKYLVLQRRKIR